MCDDEDETTLTHKRKHIRDHAGLYLQIQRSVTANRKTQTAILMNSSTDVMDYHIRQNLSVFYVYKKENCVFHVVTWLTVTLSVLFSVLSYSLQIKASVK